MPEGTHDRRQRIAVVGAGAAGLSVAHFLRQRGYERVSVFEKLGRVGGLCQSITAGGKAFDLGGNYVTPAYRETLALARSVGARRIKARQYLGSRVEGEEVQYYKLFDLVRQDPQDPNRRVGRIALIRAVLRFGWLRHKLSPLLEQPTLEKIEEHPELCVSFEQWLKDNDLEAMRGLFLIPITTFGYGFLDEIPAPYALKYMHPRTYRAMILRGLPGLRSLARWPQRFEDGFQRMWERVAWGLDVRLDTRIEEIQRDPTSQHPIRIRLRRTEQVMNDQRPRVEELYFDRLVLACPLTLDAFGKLGLDVSEEEHVLFGKVHTYSYCHTIVYCVDEEGNDFLLKEPVVIVFPFNRETIGKPWAVVQYWGKQSPLIQLYTRLPEGSSHEMGETVRKPERELLERMKAHIVGDRDPNQARWQGHTCWPYFGHVGVEDMKKGFFRDLERLQGENHTYYVGGATNFELIEPIVQYSKHLVETHFA